MCSCARGGGMHGAGHARLCVCKLCQHARARPHTQPSSAACSSADLSRLQGEGRCTHVCTHTHTLTHTQRPPHTPLPSPTAPLCAPKRGRRFIFRDGSIGVWWGGGRGDTGTHAGGRGDTGGAVPTPHCRGSVGLVTAEPLSFSVPLREGTKVPRGGSLTWERGHGDMGI